MRTVRNFAFVALAVTFVLAARANVIAWSSFAEWQSYYQSVCPSFDEEEQGNRYSAVCSCYEDTECQAALGDFCQGYFGTCQDYCEETWPDPGVVLLVDCDGGGEHGFFNCECEPEG